MVLLQFNIADLQCEAAKRQELVALLIRIGDIFIKFANYLYMTHANSPSESPRPTKMFSRIIQLRLE